MMNNLYFNLLMGLIPFIGIFYLTNIEVMKEKNWVASLVTLLIIYNLNILTLPFYFLL